jgi:hypothetical protein
MRKLLGMSVASGLTCKPTLHMLAECDLRFLASREAGPAPHPAGRRHPRPTHSQNNGIAQLWYQIDLAARAREVILGSHLPHGVGRALSSFCGRDAM